MRKASLNELQISALSRVNFCFYELKQNPPLVWENNVVDTNSLPNTISNFCKLSIEQQSHFRHELFEYLKRESTTEAHIMLVINYLAALLIKGRNNQISIHKNLSIDTQEIESFESEHGNLLKRLSCARDKYYAHIDLDWQDVIESISFEEMEICIDFLNKLLNYSFEQYWQK